VTKAARGTPALLWEMGTGYELFISLTVLHGPEYYGLRASWAAGIRSRIPAPERKFLEEVVPFLPFPLGWVHNLPEPRDSISALWALRQIPPERRLPLLVDIDSWEHAEIKAIWLRITEAHRWKKSDLTALQKAMHGKGEHFNEKAFPKLLDWLARPAELGEALVTALQAYYQVFFAEEERRIQPVLQSGLERARKRSEGMRLADLLVDLSQGVHFEDVQAEKLILVPAYWTTPLVILEKISPTESLFLFGARPATMSALPGELVPDRLLRSLKALADSTRLKILYDISQEEVTPSQLSRRLHLRAPTVTHHLNELRLAGLVNLTFRGQEKLYRARLEAIEEAFHSLKQFLRKTPQ